MKGSDFYRAALYAILVFLAIVKPVQFSCTMLLEFADLHLTFYRPVNNEYAVLHVT